MGDFGKVPNFESMWGEYRLSELRKYHINFIYWLLDKYYLYKKDKHKFSKEEVDEIISFVLNEYEKHICKEVGCFYIHLGNDFYKNRSVNSRLQRVYRSWDGEYDIKELSIGSSGATKLWCCVFSEPIIIIDRTVWGKVKEVDEIRRVRGSVYYISSVQKKVHNAQINSIVDRNKIFYKTNPNVASLTYSKDSVERLVSHIFNSRKKGRNVFVDPLDYFFNETEIYNRHEKTHQNRTTLSGYIQDLFVKTYREGRGVEKLSYIMSLAEDFEVSFSIKEALDRVENFMGSKTEDLNRLIEMQKNIINEVSNTREDVSKIKDKTQSIISSVESISQITKSIREDVSSGKIEPNDFVDILSEKISEEVQISELQDTKKKIDSEYPFVKEMSGKVGGVSSFVYSSEYLYQEVLARRIEIDSAPVIVEYSKIPETALERLLAEPIEAFYTDSDPEWNGLITNWKGQKKPIHLGNLGCWKFITHDRSQQYSRWITEQLSPPDDLADFLIYELSDFTEEIRELRNGAAHESSYGISEVEEVRSVVMVKKDKNGSTLLERIGDLFHATMDEQLLSNSSSS